VTSRHTLTHTLGKIIGKFQENFIFSQNVSIFLSKWANFAYFERNKNKKLENTRFSWNSPMTFPVFQPIMCLLFIFYLKNHLFLPSSSPKICLSATLSDKMKSSSQENCIVTVHYFQIYFQLKFIHHITPISIKSCTFLREILNITIN